MKNCYRSICYDPSSGRFVQKDPIGLAAGDTNLYRYVGNNPVNYIDPSGEILIIPTDNSAESQKNRNAISKISSSKTGADFINRLASSKNVFNVTYVKGLAQANPFNFENASNGTGSGGTVSRDPNMNLGVSLDIVLAHEFGHLLDYDYGTLDRSPIGPINSPVRRSEVRGVNGENQYRDSQGSSRRNDYGGIPIPNSLEQPGESQCR